MLPGGGAHDHAMSRLDFGRSGPDRRGLWRGLNAAGRRGHVGTVGGGPASRPGKPTSSLHLASLGAGEVTLSFQVLPSSDSTPNAEPRADSDMTPGLFLGQSEFSVLALSSTPGGNYPVTGGDRVMPRVPLRQWVLTVPTAPGRSARPQLALATVIPGRRQRNSAYCKVTKSVIRFTGASSAAGLFAAVGSRNWFGPATYGLCEAKA